MELKKNKEEYPQYIKCGGFYLKKFGYTFKKLPIYKERDGKIDGVLPTILIGDKVLFSTLTEEIIEITEEEYGRTNDE